MRKTIYAHRWAIFLSLTAAFLVAAPTFFSIWALGSEYSGMPFLYQDNEAFYLARIQEITDGHPSVGSPIIFEYKDSPTPLAPTGEYFYALPALVLGWPAHFITSLSKFLLPWLLFLLVYALTFLLIRNISGAWPKLFAMLAASLVILGFDLVHFPEIANIFKAGSDSLYLSVWTRLVHPVTGGLFLFVFLFSIWGVIRGRKLAWILAGVSFGLTIGYIFSFGLALAVLLVLFVVYALKRRFDILRGLAAALLVGFFLNIFNTKNFLAMAFSPEGTALSLRNGLLLTHVPLLNKLLIVSALVWLAVLIFERRGRGGDRGRRDIADADILVGALIVGSIVAMNQQVFTGKIIWPHHFVQYTIPFAFIILSLTAARFFKFRFRQPGATLALLLIIISFLFGLRTLGSYTAVIDDFSYKQRYQPVLDWLNINAEKDCVVFAWEQAEIIAPLIPALTHCNSYFTTYNFVGIAYDDIKPRYLSRLRLNGVTPDNIETYLSANSVEVQANFFRDWKELFLHSRDPWLVSISDRPAIYEWKENQTAAVISDYQDFYQKDFYTELKKFRLNYVIWDESAEPASSPDEFDFLKPVYSFSGVHLYEVR